MTSVICQNFVQNAWKKELCSNCFKSKDEHMSCTKLKPICLINIKNIDSIMKTQKSKSKPKRTVCFDKDLSEIIGFGGEIWSDNSDDEYENNSDNNDDFVAESEDEDMEELKRITKENTNYNSTSLKESPPQNQKKSYNQLKLGKPVVDAAGKKQTLMVSVTPFGEDVPSHPKKFNRNISHIPISKNNKETISETKNNVILKSYIKNEDEKSKEEKSLLEEITETLENNKNSIISKKKLQTIVADSESNKENINEKKGEQEPVKLPKIVSERKVSLTRTPALKRDQEKPVVQTSTAKIELLNSRNNKVNKIMNEDKKIEESLPEIKTNESSSINDVPKSREQVGEPDGRADSDIITEPPALPLTPPPPLAEIQTSFLHSSQTIYDKPKLLTKPITTTTTTTITTTATVTTTASPPPPPIQHIIPITNNNKNHNNNNNIEVTNEILTSFLNESKDNQEKKLSLTKQDSNNSDPGRINKRRAPKPPEESGIVYTRNSIGITNSDSPVVREKEKRERATSCSPKYPEPIPRKCLSTENLINDEKRKEKIKGRFSLKKFLRMGSNKDLPKQSIENKNEDELPPLPKPRLVIVHPLDLNGEKVEVVSKPHYEYQNIIKSSETFKPIKPPPPPRNFDIMKPQLPHPPKSLEILSKQKQYRNNYNNNKCKETVYANIGEVRSAIVPNKPQRTASMREREAQQQKQTYKKINSENRDQLYDYINNGLSSSSDSDSSPNKNSPTSIMTVRLNKRSESSIDVSGDYFKYNNIPRSMSLTYCGSETESEIYAPYSFYGSESEVTEDDHDWIQNSRTHKLRSRKGRSIVHKNLEDNYGAVVIANHEALAQVLENIQQTVHIQPALRGLKTLPNLRWSDFTIKNPKSLVIGCRIFHQALWGTHPVTLITCTGVVPPNTLSLGTFGLMAITEFSDLIPVKFVSTNENDEKLIQASIAVLGWAQINNIKSFSDNLSKNSDDNWKDISFIMLQLVNALKLLQAQGIEELSLSLNSFLLCKEMEKDPYYRLCILQGVDDDFKNNDKSVGSLCMCAAKALNLLKPSLKISSLIQSILNNEKSVSLTQVKSILEFTLWGPSDVILGNTIKERELALQRWLDLQRATVLHGLVCTRVQLTVYEECHLMFLVRSNSRIMCDASLLIESNNRNYTNEK